MSCLTVTDPMFPVVFFWKFDSDSAYFRPVTVIVNVASGAVVEYVAVEALIVGTT